MSSALSGDVIEAGAGAIYARMPLVMRYAWR